MTATTIGHKAVSSFSVSKNERRNAPTIHVAGIAVLLLVPGLLLSLVIEWASSTSHEEIPLLVTAIFAAAIGITTIKTTTIKETMAPAGVFAAVGWSWVVCSVIGALPYVLGSMFAWHQFDYALFESVSGFSATGSTVLSDIEANGRGILMWRQITQFYGGMGMVVLAVTILPLLGVGGLSLISAEAPGVSTDRLSQRASATARVMWSLYLGITASIALLLWAIAGLSPYDAFAHSLTATSTGGFSPNNASLGHYDSVAAEVIIGVGILICAFSFTLHFKALRGDVRSYWRSAEARAYLALVIGAISIATLINWLGTVKDTAGNVLEVGFGGALRDSFFTVATLSSCAGFGNARGADSLGNYVLWNPGLQVMLLLLMILGGSSGSTAGGAKIFRVYVGVKHAIRSIQRVRHPRMVKPLRLGEVVLSHSIERKVIGYLTVFAAITLAGTVALAATGLALVESISAVITAMSGVGPGLGALGPTESFLAVPRLGRLILCALMLIGRLELFAMLLMFAAPIRVLRKRFAS